MRIFADHCVHTDVVEALRQAGFRVKRAIEVKLHKSSDDEVFNYILKTSRVLLSFDHDFINILRFNTLSSAGVVVFEIERLRRETIIKRVVNFFSKYSSRDLRGTLFIIDLAGRVRLWPRKRI